VAASLVLAAAACSGGGDDEAAEATTGAGDSSVTTAAPPDGTTAPAPAVPCPEDRHAVVVDLRLLVASENELYTWFGDAAYEPLVRPGAVELLQAYFQRNYEVVYVTGWASDTLLGETVPVTEAVPRWIAEHGFPNGDATSLHMWDPAATANENVHKTEVVVDLVAAGVTVDRVYVGDETDVPAYRNGGVTGDGSIWSFDLDADPPGAPRIPGNDLVAHREATVDGEGDVCTRASAATTSPG
jgi:hypothetical protein